MNAKSQFKGGLDEFYCSRVCYVKSGAAIAQLSSQRLTDACGYCGESTSPFRGGDLMSRTPDKRQGRNGVAFLSNGQQMVCCEVCFKEKLVSWIGSLTECFWCGKSLTGDLQSHAVDSRTAGSAHICPTCQQPLAEQVSGAMARFLGLDSWPCPKCDLRATAAMVSEKGVAVENGEFVITVRHGFSSFEVLGGIGSIASPAQKAAPWEATTGRHAFEFIKFAFDPQHRAAVRGRFTAS